MNLNELHLLQFLLMGRATYTFHLNASVISIIKVAYYFLALIGFYIFESVKLFQTWFNDELLDIIRFPFVLGPNYVVETLTERSVLNV